MNYLSGAKETRKEIEGFNLNFKGVFDNNYTNFNFPSYMSLNIFPEELFSGKARSLIY